jgi:glucokinase-like ROK family protein
MAHSIGIFGSSNNQVKVHNIQAILLTLLREKQYSRVELAKKLSLSNTTITNLTTELLAQGIIAEEPDENSDELRSVGRPRKMLRLVPKARYVIGIHIGVKIIRIAIIDLFANIVQCDSYFFELDQKPESVIQNIVQLTENLIQSSKIDKAKVIGIGVGAPGLVNHDLGINVLAPRLNWENVPIRELIESQINIPVCVDNNVRTMALAEAFFGDGRGVSVLAFVYGRIGVGSGIVVNEQVFRGSGAGAGEIGHTTIIPKGGKQCTCGNTGCLETLLSEPVWIQHIEEIASENPESLIASYLRAEDDRTYMERVFSAARDGDQTVLDFIEDRACYLGIALANLINILNPEMIILGGMFSQGGDLIIPAAEAKMREAAFAGLGENVELLVTSFKTHAGVIGAGALALTRFFYQNSEIK